jgi:Zn finger protein HypA/HybF involved in hydrogenase expression
LGDLFSLERAVALQTGKLVYVFHGMPATSDEALDRPGYLAPAEGEVTAVVWKSCEDCDEFLTMPLDVHDCPDCGSHGVQEHGCAIPRARVVARRMRFS